MTNIKNEEETNKLIGKVSGRIYDTNRIGYQILDLGSKYIDAGWRLEEYDVIKMDNKIYHVEAIFSTDEFEFAIVDGENSVESSERCRVEGPTVEEIVNYLEELKETVKDENKNLDKATLTCENGKVKAEIIINKYQNVIKRVKVKTKMPAKYA